MLPLLMLLTACADVPKPAVYVPPDQVMVDCWATIPADLKSPNVKAPPLWAGQMMVEALAQAQKRERAKDRRYDDLLAAVKGCDR